MFAIDPLTGGICQMNCTQCGAEAPAGAAFCPQCGAQLDAARAGNPTRAVAASRLQSAVPQGAARDVPEQELWSGAYSPKAMTGWFIVAALVCALGIAAVVYADAGPTGWAAVGIAALVIFGYLGLLVAYRRMSVRYRLTTHRLVLEKGILGRTDERVLLVDIDDIAVHQSFINRIFNLGKITLITSDQTAKDTPDRDNRDIVKPKSGNKGEGILILDGIENPSQVGDLIDEARRTERTRRGLYMMNA
jgi:membrane protein YdbS with pleckstrin-like domain